MPIPQNPISRIQTLSNAPTRIDGAFDNWILQVDTPVFLKDNASAEETIIRLSADHTFFQAIVVPEADVDAADHKELREWDLMHDRWGLNYSWSEPGTIWLEAPFESDRIKPYRNAEPLTVHRTFEGYEKDKSYFEILQKLTHSFDLHYVPHLKAWCRLDGNGDIEPVVKHYSLPEAKSGYGGYIITIKRDVLDTFLLAGKYKAVCAFDFTRTDFGSFNGWDNTREESEVDTEGLIYRLTVQPTVGSYLRGVQILEPLMNAEKAISRLRHGGEPKEYASFIAFDTKNNAVKEISCAPGATANYFTESSLPFEVTSAFFRPEVLQRYKADTAKYRVDERSINCRGAWSLKTYDINDAGQVHTYLVYLRDLPFSEQLYWKSFNEKPKGSISKRAFTTDIEGDFFTEYNALQSLLHILKGLDKKVQWWALKDGSLPSNIHYPATQVADEWAEAILRLDQLVVEGLNTKWLKRCLDALSVTYPASEGSLGLLSRALQANGFDEEQAKSAMAPLRDLHHLRSKVKGHVKGDEAEALRQAALQEHGTYRKHFEVLCESCDASFRRITRALNSVDQASLPEA
jgi:hypothetical protein